MRVQQIINILLLVIVILIVFTMVTLYVSSAIKKKKKEQEFFIGTKNKVNQYRLLELYNRLVKLKPFRKFLENLRIAHEMKLPGNTRESKEAAMKMALFMWAACIICVTATIIFGFTLYHILCGILAAYFICNEYSRYQYNKYDTIILKDLDKFVDLVQFHFSHTKMPDQALLAAIQETKSKYMRSHGQRILDVLEEVDDFTVAIKEFNQRNSNYHIKAFAEVIFIIFEYGDKEIDGMSLFVSSLLTVKNDIREQLNKNRRLNSAFTLLSSIVVIPVYGLDFLRGVGVDSFTSVADLYYGSYGYLAMFGLFIITFIVYKLVIRMKSTVVVDSVPNETLIKIYHIRPMRRMINSMMNRNWGKTLRLKELLRKTGNVLLPEYFITKRVCYFAVAFVVTVIALNCLHVHNRSYYVSRVVDIGNSTSGASDEEGVQMVLLGRYYIDKYKDTNIRRAYNAQSGKQPDMFFDDEVEKWFTSKVLHDIKNSEISFNRQKAFETCVEYLDEHQSTSSNLKSLIGLTYEDAINSNDHLVTIGMNTLDRIIAKTEVANPLSVDKQTQLVASSVVSKIRKSQNEYFHWWEVIVAAFIAWCAYMEPLLILLFDKKALQRDMGNEIAQFQSVILVLMHMERMTAEKIMEWMLMFSRIFEPSLRKCVNNMPLDEEAALEELKEDEPFDDFCSLINSIIMIDKVGIYQAFINLPSDRKNHQEVEKIENEISVKNRSAIGTTIALAPFMAVVVLYLVLPFAIAAVGDLAYSMQSVSDIM